MLPLGMALQALTNTLLFAALLFTVAHFFPDTWKTALASRWCPVLLDIRRRWAFRKQCYLVAEGKVGLWRAWSLSGSFARHLEEVRAGRGDYSPYGRLRSYVTHYRGWRIESSDCNYRGSGKVTFTSVYGGRSPFSPHAPGVPAIQGFPVIQYYEHNYRIGAGLERKLSHRVPSNADRYMRFASMTAALYAERDNDADLGVPGFISGTDGSLDFLSPEPA